MVGFRCCGHRQNIALIFLWRDIDISQGHNSGQRCKITDKLRQLMVVTYDFKADRQFGIKIFVLLVLWFEQYKLEPAPQTRLGYVNEQFWNLSLVRQLAQHDTETLLHFFHLLSVGWKIKGQLLFLTKRCS